LVQGPAPATVDDLVNRRYLQPQYQPIFDLTSGEQVSLMNRSTAAVVTSGCCDWG